MNPTLSARLRDWQRDPYWRVHPPAPWLVPVEPATALLHQSSMPADSQAAGMEPTCPHSAGSQAAHAQPAGCLLAASPTAASSTTAAPSADFTPTDDQPDRWQTAVPREAPPCRDAAVSGDVDAAPAPSHAGGSWAADSTPADWQAVINPGAVSRDIAAHPANRLATVAAKAATAAGETSSVGLAVHDPVQAAAGQPQAAQAPLLRLLIGMLIVGLVSLMEGWLALRRLVEQIRAIWWAPTTAERAPAPQLRPGVAVPFGVLEEASR